VWLTSAPLPPSMGPTTMTGAVTAATMAVSPYAWLLRLNLHRQGMDGTQGYFSVKETGKLRKVTRLDRVFRRGRMGTQAWCICC
jgi:hypothetical protein